MLIFCGFVLGVITAYSFGKAVDVSNLEPASHAKCLDGHQWGRWEPEGSEAWQCQWRSCMSCGYTEKRRT